MPEPEFTVADVARICHEANRAIQHIAGDPDPSPPWDDAPAWQRGSAIQGVQTALAGDLDPEAHHQAWCDAKTAEGWTWGPTKDPVAKTHPCLVPYDELPVRQQAKDRVFLAVVETLRPLL